MPPVTAEAKERKKQYQKRYWKKHYARNRASFARRNRKYYESHRTNVIIRAKKNYERDPEARFFYMIDYKFGCSREQYLTLLQQQNGVCAICSKSPDGRFKRLAVDHDHKTGCVRGLLCSRCNRAIGLLGDDPGMLAQATRYLVESAPCDIPVKIL